MNSLSQTSIALPRQINVTKTIIMHEADTIGLLWACNINIVISLKVRNQKLFLLRIHPQLTLKLEVANKDDTWCENIAIENESVPSNDA